MTYNQLYFESKKLAGLHDPKTGIRVYTMLQHPGEPAPAIAAYMAARYSRSPDSIFDIINEVQEKDVDAEDRLGKIFNAYGHASVGDMAHLFVCIERVPMLTAMRFFYLNPCQSGMERSTRYQDFSEPQIFNAFPTELPQPLREQWQQIMLKHFQVYQDLEYVADELGKFYAVTESAKDRKALAARTFDTLRYLIPWGTLTNFGAIMSARDWSTYIGLMRGSTQVAERTVGDMLYHLLGGVDQKLLEAGYVPEAAALIRHAEPNSTAHNTVLQLKGLCKKLADQPLPRINCAYGTARTALSEHVFMLSKHTSRPTLTRLAEYAELFAPTIFANHDQYTSLGPIGQHGAIQIRGRTDMGTLKDLNRHRSLEHFIPFLENTVDWDMLLKQGFEHCPYLSDPAFNLTRQILHAHYRRTYEAIYAWAKAAQSYLSSESLLEYVRYALPHAHSTEYVFYGSINDLNYTLRTRHRPGGHISYRSLMSDWAQSLSELDRFWQPLAEHLPSPDPLDKQQFFDRS